MIFFDQTFVDYSFSARFYRQKSQISQWLRRIRKYLVRIYADLDLAIWYLWKRLQKHRAKEDPRGATFEIIGTSNYKNEKDMTINAYIDKHGGIYSHADNKVHTSKASYLNGLKEKNCTIKDW